MFQLSLGYETPALLWYIWSVRCSRASVGIILEIWMCFVASDARNLQSDYLEFLLWKLLFKYITCCASQTETKRDI